MEHLSGRAWTSHLSEEQLACGLGHVWADVDMVDAVEAMGLSEIRAELDWLIDQRGVSRLSPLAHVRYQLLAMRERQLIMHDVA